MSKRWFAASRSQLGHRARLLANHPTRRQRNAPTALRALGFRAIQEGVRPPAVLVVLDAPLGHLRVHRLEHGLLRRTHFLGHLLAAADDVECTPGEQRGHRIQVRPVGFATDARRFEGHAAAAAERIPHPRHAPEAPLAQFPHQPRQTGGAGVQMRVYGFPGFRRRPIQMLRPGAIAQLLVVAHAIKDKLLQSLSSFRLDALLELEAVRCRAWRKPFPPFLRRQQTEYFLERNVASLAPPQAICIHGEQS